MSVKKDASGRRSVQVEIEVPGSPEEVWQARPPELIYSCRCKAIDFRHAIFAVLHEAFLRWPRSFRSVGPGGFPNGLGKKRLKLYDERYQLDRQCLHIEDIF